MLFSFLKRNADLAVILNNSTRGVPVKNGVYQSPLTHLSHHTPVPSDLWTVKYLKLRRIPWEVFLNFPQKKIIDEQAHYHVRVWKLNIMFLRYTRTNKVPFRVKREFFW